MQKSWYTCLANRARFPRISSKFYVAPKFYAGYELAGFGDWRMSSGE